jgi:hypothetical protein
VSNDAGNDQDNLNSIMHLRCIYDARDNIGTLIFTALQTFHGICHFQEGEIISTGEIDDNSGSLISGTESRSG